MSLLVSETEVAAAEGDIASMRFHIGRLPPGFVRTRLLEALCKIEAEVSSAKSNQQSALAASGAAGLAPNDFVVVEHMVEEEAAGPVHVEERCENEVALEAKQKLERALSNGEGSRPRSSYEAAALCIHALLASKAEGFPGLRCIGVPAARNKEQPKTTPGFAAPVRELEPGKLVPPGWNDQGRDTAAFKYRRATFSATPSSEVIELRCVRNDRGAQRLVGLTVASSGRGELHCDEIAVEFDGHSVPCSRFDELADYVRDVVAPRLEPPESAPNPSPPPPPYEEQPRGIASSSFQWVPPPPLHPPPPPPSARYDFERQGDEFVGPSHPMFGGGDASVSASPRFDPILPGEGPRGGPIFPGGQPQRGSNKPRLPGEPNFDHLQPPGGDNDSMFL